MLKKALTTAILIASIGMTLPAAAAIGRIISQNDAAEADRINVILGKNGHVERIRVEGCTKCPLELQSSGNTRFKYQGKQIREQDAKTHSGKSGTVIFDAETAQAIKVNW